LKYTQDGDVKTLWCEPDEDLRERVAMFKSEKQEEEEKLDSLIRDCADLRERIAMFKSEEQEEEEKLNSLIRVGAEVEVYSQDDWWNARIDKITIVNRKSAEILVSYEQSPGVYENEGDEIRFEVRQADGIWVYADKIRARQQGQAGPSVPVLAAPSAGGE
jgi:pullulanase/glycogen debranching enzyme